MRKIASPNDLEQELRSLLASCEKPNPSRVRLAHKLKDLASRVSTREKYAAMSESEFWKITEPYGWGTKTKDYKAIEKDLLRKLSPDEAEDLRDAFDKLKSKLYKALDKVVEGLGDDGFDDLLSHIVGMGKREYDATLKNPERGAARANKYDFSESFAYALPHKSDYERLNVTKYITWAKEIASTYEKILKASDDDVPFLPKIKKDLQDVVKAMEGFVRSKDVHALLDQENDIKGAAENIDRYLSRINVGWTSDAGSIEDAIRQAGNKHWIWNLFHDIKQYLT